MSGKLTEPVQRLDRWLWFARMVKNRALAARVIEDGKVRVNRVRVVKPGHALRAGDVLTIALRGRVLVLEVMAAGTRRGPAAEARLLYKRLDGAGRDEGQLEGGGVPSREGE